MAVPPMVTEPRAFRAETRALAEFPVIMTVSILSPERIPPNDTELAVKVITARSLLIVPARTPPMVTTGTS